MSSLKYVYNKIITVIFEVGYMKRRANAKAAMLIMILVLGFTACTEEQPVNNNETQPKQQQTVDIQKDEEKDIVKPQPEKEKTEAEPEGMAITIAPTVYEEQLKIIYSVLTEPEEMDPFEMEGMTGIGEWIRYSDTAKILRELGYAIMDVNGDKVPELLIADIQKREGDISLGNSLYTLYSYVDGKVVCLLDGYARNQYALLEDGYIYNTGSSGALYYGSMLYTLPQGADALQCMECYFTHERNGNYEDIAVYHNTTGSWNAEESEETTMTLSEFYAREEEFEKKKLEFEIIPFSRYESAKPLDLADFAEEKVTENTFCAVAYLGYFGGDYEGLVPYLKEIGYLNKYPFLENMDKEQVILTEGGEWYLLLPTQEDMDLRISQALMNENDYSIREGKVLYKEKGNKPVLVRGNVSEIMPNLLLTIENTQGESLTYSPVLSMMDGTLQHIEGILDITSYECIPNMAFEIITDPQTPEYEFYEYRAYSVATPIVNEENPTPIMFMALKDEMNVKIELIAWNEDGSDYLIDLLEEVIISKGEVLFINSMLQETEPPLRITAAFTEDGVYKTAVWYGYIGENGTYYNEYVSGY